MKKEIKLPLTLALVSLVCGLTLSSVHVLTKPRIEKNELIRENKILFEMFANLKEENITKVDSKGYSEFKSVSKINYNSKTYYAYKIEFEDNFGGDISSFIVVIDSDNKVYDLKFTSTGDNYAKKYDDVNYISSLKGKSDVSNMEITGATVTGKSVTSLINKAISHCKGVK